MTEDQIADETLRLTALVRGFFNDDNKKALLWWVTPNPFLGGVTPCFMIASGRIEKLRAFIENSLEQNEPKPAQRASVF